ncbi:MAG: hypothetical protein K5866_05875 [Treponema sp.]|nr:hypothetical protein [Treponema sp.]
MKTFGFYFRYSRQGGYCIEKWILWLKGERSCSPDTCNNRMSTFRGFLKYLDVSIAEKAEALATLEDEKEASLPKKWEMDDGSLSEFLGLPR